MTGWIAPGAFCRDRRENIYKIITLARDVQTGEGMVVYRKEEDKSDEAMCCPTDAFCVSFFPVSGTESKGSVRLREVDPPDKMMRFLDTDDIEEKVKLLKEIYLRGELNDNIIDNFAATLDFVIDPGDIQLRYDQLRVCLETRARFESSRLRKGAS